MQKLGLIGGTGPEATVMYYRGLIEGVGKVHGQETLPKLSIESLSPFEVFKYCTSDDLAGLTDYLLSAIHNLAAAGAEVAALTAGTTHIVYDELAARSPIPLVSMLDATRDEALARKVKTVALLGTGFTMSKGFFAAPFEAAGIRVVVPSKENIEIIQNLIATELEHGIVKEETRELFVEIIKELVANEGAEQVILGCTELPLILNDTVSPVLCLDPVPLHIDALVKRIAA